MAASPPVAPPEIDSNNKLDSEILSLLRRAKFLSFQNAIKVMMFINVKYMAISFNISQKLCLL